MSCKVVMLMVSIAIINMRAAPENLSFPTRCWSTSDRNAVYRSEQINGIGPVNGIGPRLR